MTMRVSIPTLLAAVGLLAGLSLPVLATEVVTRRDGTTVVEAPTTRVRVNEGSGAARVKVRAPATRVDVDSARGRVRVHVPYFDGDIRW